jgi:uncharacterized coiled-coil protein SlyX
MARISITTASQQFNVSRNTLYKKIKNGDITKDSDGKLDTNDLIRLFNVNKQTVPEEQNNNLENEQSLFMIEHLKQQIANQQQVINDLKEQIDYLKKNEQWLKDQLNQRLIEDKSNSKQNKKGLISRFFN